MTSITKNLSLELAPTDLRQHRFAGTYVSDPMCSTSPHSADAGVSADDPVSVMQYLRILRGRADLATLASRRHRTG